MVETTQSLLAIARAISETTDLTETLRRVCRGRAGACYLVGWRTRQQQHEAGVTILAAIGQLVGVLLQNVGLARLAEARRGSAEAAEERYRLLFEENLAGILRTRQDGRI